MVHVIIRRCSNVSCTKQQSLNFERSTAAAHYKQHDEDGMVDVVSKRYSRDTCTSQPTLNITGSMIAEYCKRYAEDGMVDVRSIVCPHNSALCSRVGVS